jgi:hypothetical protein
MFRTPSPREESAVLKSRLSVATLFFVSTVATAAPHGILPEDINRKGVPCDDFYNYANGAWRAQNAIPDYMDRWSRRWQSGEVNKEHVRDILEEVSAKPDQPKGSAGQLAGDYYAACMNEAAVDATGLKPIEPMLARVRAIKDREGIAREIVALSAYGIAAPVPVYGAQDLHEPTMVIAHVDAGGLGLPDRDYYLKSEQRFIEARAKYLEHMQKMFVLAGDSPDAAKAKAVSVLAFERRLAEASLDNVALRDPKQQDHKMSFAQLQKLTPSFDWAAYFDAANLPHADLNVAQPAFLARFEELLSKRDIADWRNYLEWSLYNNAADRLSKPVVEQNFAFYGKYLSGATTMKPRAIRCASDVDGQLGEALGKAYVEKYFPPEAKVRMESMVDNIVWAMGDTIRGLQWMSDQTKAKALEKLASFNRKIGYPDKWRDYKGVEVGPRLLLGRCHVGGALERRRQPQPGRQAGGPHALGHDAADLQRLLQPEPQRDRVPGRHPATAGLRRDRHRRGQLRRDRRGDRPRDQPRLRRPGRAVRRAGPAGELVDRRRPEAVHRPWHVRGESVRGLLHRAGRAPQRQAGAGRIDRRSRRREARLQGLPAFARRQGTRAHPRRIHARAAVLHRLGPVARRRDPHGDAAHHGAGRPAPGRQVARQRPAVEPARLQKPPSSARPATRWFATKDRCDVW